MFRAVDTNQLHKIFLLLHCVQRHRCVADLADKLDDLWNERDGLIVSNILIIRILAVMHQF